MRSPVLRLAHGTEIGLWYAMSGTEIGLWCAMPGTEIGLWYAMPDTETYTWYAMSGTEVGVLRYQTSCRRLRRPSELPASISTP
eukprot:3121575-Rhodomonas_salina.1